MSMISISSTKEDLHADIIYVETCEIFHLIEVDSVDIVDVFVATIAKEEVLHSHKDIYAE